jgi:hypothetical protein
VAADFFFQIDIGSIVVDIGIDTWWQFALAVLGTWRVSHLLTQEDGPADFVIRIRARLGSSLLGSAMDCFYCMSMWVAVPMTAVLNRPAGESILIWLAMSGAACLLERVTALSEIATTN